MLIFDLNESGDLAAIAVLGLTMLLLSSAVLAVANLMPRLMRRATRTERIIPASWTGAAGGLRR